MSLTKEQTEQFVSRWCEELRSGKYKQGTGKLRSLDDNFCCLGVGCEVAREFIDGISCVPVNSPNRMMYRFAQDPSGGNSFTMPYKLYPELGLSSQDGRYTTSDSGTTLATQNDSGKTFNEIADIIEQNKTQLFPILAT